jgi:hypothetical protein
VNWDSTTDTVQGWVDSTQVINYSGAFGAFGSATSGRVRLGSSLSATPTFMLTGRELRFRLFSGRALNAADRAAMLADGHP